VIVLGNDAMMRKAAGVGVIPVKCDGSKMSRMCWGRGKGQERWRERSKM